MDKSTPTHSQRLALDWLRERNGEGTFERSNHVVLIAGGERAPFTRSTWNALRNSGHVTITGHRIKIVSAPPALAEDK